MKSGLSLRESKEEEQGMLEKDIIKFNKLIKQLQAHVVAVEKLMEEKEKYQFEHILRYRIINLASISSTTEISELENMLKHKTFTRSEIEHLIALMHAKATNSDGDEGDREKLPSPSSHFLRLEASTSSPLNKHGEERENIHAAISTHVVTSRAFEEDEIFRLKLGNDFQYELNAKGLTPAEVFRMDYKSTLNPALKSASDDVKRTLMENLESLISLQQFSSDINAKIDNKRNRITIRQSQIQEEISS